MRAAIRRGLGTAPTRAPGFAALSTVCAIAWLGLVAVAEAGTLTREGTTVVFTESNADLSVNDVEVVLFSGDHSIGDASEPIDVDAGSGCTPTGSQPGFVRCPGATAFRISLGGGNDSLVSGLSCCEPASVPLIVDGGNGDDEVIGGAADDLIDGGFGSDVINGGGGAADLVTYAGRSVGVTVNLGVSGPGDGSSEDGPVGARDVINGGDVEGVVGGSGADTLDGNSLGALLRLEGGGGGDTLRGGAGPNILRGGAGGDSLLGGGESDFLEGGDGGDAIDGLGGADFVRAGSGFDHVEARDGVADDVDCGPDDDSALTDAIDTRTNCDPPAPPAAGTTPTTIAPPVRLRPRLAFRFRATARATRLRRLRLTRVQRGSTVTAKCRTRKGKRCRRTRGFRRRNASGRVRLRRFERRPLPVGAKLEIRVTKAGTVGAVKILRMRKRRKPSVTTRCLPPGAKRPSRC